MKQYLIHIEEINGNKEENHTHVVNQYDKNRIMEIIKESEENDSKRR